MEQGEIILYQPDEAIKLEVRMEDETVWLTQAQIVELFQSSKANISEHIKNIYEQEELEEVQLFGISEQFGKRVSVMLFVTLHIIIWMQSYPLAFVSIANEVFNFVNGRIRY